MNSNQVVFQQAGTHNLGGAFKEFVFEILYFFEN